MKCPRCNSDKIVKAGKNLSYHLINGVIVPTGFKQKYLCKNCRRLTVNPILDDDDILKS